MQKLLNKLSVEYLLLTTCELSLLDIIEVVLQYWKSIEMHVGWVVERRKGLYMDKLGQNTDERMAYVTVTAQFQKGDLKESKNELYKTRQKLASSYT